MKQKSSKIIMKGNRANFRPVTINDLKIIKNWRNSQGIREYNSQFTLLNMSNQIKWFEQINNKNSDREMFLVTDKQGKPMGICGMIHIDKKNRSGSIAIILGEQKIHGKGIGTEILKMLINYGFMKLKLHRIEAEIFSFNEISIRLFTKLSFKHDATKRDSLWRNNKWWNIHIFSLLKKDYENI
jgi:RimJ/RimL family protein N-acetyltransferase